jgi:hypothetical protein
MSWSISASGRLDVFQQSVESQVGSLDRSTMPEVEKDGAREIARHAVKMLTDVGGDAQASLSASGYASVQDGKVVSLNESLSLSISFPVRATV